MYVISLSNISIKKNVKICKFVQYYEGDYILRMMSNYLLSLLQQCHVTAKSLSVSLYNRSTTSFYIRTVGCTVAGNIEFLSLEILICFTPHFNDMTSLQSSSAKKISCDVASFFYHHSVVTQYPIRRSTIFNFKEKYRKY